jgi:hypothetical protein
MKVRLNNIYAFCFLFLLLSFELSAQESFRFSAAIGKVPADGFYRISLSPDVVAKSKRDLSDIRIIDHNKAFVPYVSQVSLPDTKASFQAYPIVRNEKESDTTTVLIVENKSAETWHTLWLNLKNSNVGRTADLSGSSDLKEWFAIDENLVMGNAYSLEKDNSYFSLNFPASSYRYLRLRIFNKDKNPLNIVQVGNFLDYQQAASYKLLPSPQLTVRDSSDKYTYLRLRFKDRYQVNKIRISVSSPRYYQRVVEIYAVNGDEKRIITEAPLSSGQDSSIQFLSREKELLVKIFNGDNPALKVKAVEVWQLNTYIMAYLEKGQEYNILTGDVKAIAPDYDLRFFTDKAMKVLKDVEHGNLSLNPLFKSSLLSPNKKDSAYLMWAGIGAALILLLLLTRNMLKEMEKKG